MPYCPNCGTQILEAANFCPSCGASLTGVTGTTTVTQTATVVNTNAIYRVILVDKGTCTKALCKEVLRDLIGYTATNAGALVDAMPVEIARNLTREQAVYISQVLTEYGMETAICDNKNSYMDFNRYAVNSVFNDSGAFMAEAAAILGTLTIANQVNNIIRWSQPNPLSFLFRPTTRRTPPPKNTWASIFGTRKAPPPPPPRPTPKPAPKPPVRPPQPPVRQPQPPVHQAPPRQTPMSSPKPPVPNGPVRNPGVGTAARNTPPKTSGGGRSFGPGPGPDGRRHP